MRAPPTRVWSWRHDVARARLARPEILALAAVRHRRGNANAYARRDQARRQRKSLSAARRRRARGERQPLSRAAAGASKSGAGGAVRSRAENIVVTRGADDAIDMLVRTFCRPAIDAVAVCTPTFSAYAHFVQLQGARLIEAPLTARFRFRRGGVHRRAQRRGEPQARLPLHAQQSDREPSRPAADPARRRCPAGDDHRCRRSLSRLRASAEPGRRGDAAGEPRRAEDALQGVRPRRRPGRLRDRRAGADRRSQRGRCRLTRCRAHRWMRRWRRWRPRAAPSTRSGSSGSRPIASGSRRFWRGSPIVRRVRPSGGNFLFLEVEDPKALAARLRALGIRVRFRPNAAPGGVRVTIGTDAENEALLRAFGVRGRDGAGRRSEVVRDTRETAIAVAVDLDRAAPRKIDTGVPFYDHMLDQVAAHGGFSLLLSCDGDTRDRCASQHRGLRDRLRHGALARRWATSAASAASASRCRWTRPRRKC